MSLDPALINTLTLKIYQSLGTGETLVELIIFHGAKINISLPIADLAGLKELPVQLLTESTS